MDLIQFFASFKKLKKHELNFFASLKSSKSMDFLFASFKNLKKTQPVYVRACSFFESLKKLKKHGFHFLHA